MMSLRLKTIAKYITKKDKVIDMGCDHGLLSLYLWQNSLCQTIVAADVNAMALANAKKNFDKYQLAIKTIISDGLNSINTKTYNTMVIAGLGTNTIINILSNQEKLKPIKKIILQSNNDWPELRFFMAKKGYYLTAEEIINDHQKYYAIMIYLKSEKKNTRFEKQFGLALNKNYFESLINQNIKIINQLPKGKYILKLQLKWANKKLKKIVNE